MRYDGIMSRLHGAPGYRVERDIHSGRQRLHLCISETTYSSFVRTQALPNNPSQLGKHAFFSRLISVNLLMLDNDDRVLMVRRHRDIAHPGRYAGAVSGACELVGRGGIDADLDTNGFPDLLATCRREAKEELGVDLDAREWALSALGLIQVHDFRDALTYVLVATARSPRPVSEFRVRVGSTDDLEGTWEVDDQALVVDLHAALSGADSLEEFVDWLRTSEELTAHGAGSLLLQSNVYLMRRDPGLGPVLAQAAAAPLPDERPRTRPRWVTSQPLWTTDRA